MWLVEKKCQTDINQISTLNLRSLLSKLKDFRFDINHLLFYESRLKLALIQIKIYCKVMSTSHLVTCLPYKQHQMAILYIKTLLFRKPNLKTCLVIIRRQKEDFVSRNVCLHSQFYGSYSVLRDHRAGLRLKNTKRLQEGTQGLQILS